MYSSGAGRAVLVLGPAELLKGTIVDEGGTGNQRPVYVVEGHHRVDGRGHKLVASWGSKIYPEQEAINWLKLNLLIPQWDCGIHPVLRQARRHRRRHADRGTAERCLHQV